MRINVELDERQIRDVESRLGDMHRQAPVAISRAMNRAVSTINQGVKTEVRKEYIIKSADIKNTLVVDKAKKNKLNAKVVSVGTPVPLDRFKLSPRTVNPKRKKPIKIGVKKSILKTSLGSFVASIHGIKVFKRTTQKRLPITRLFGPSVPQMLGNEDVRMEIQRKGQETFRNRLDHEINRLIQSGGR